MKEKLILLHNFTQSPTIAGDVGGVRLPAPSLIRRPQTLVSSGHEAKICAPVKHVEIDGAPPVQNPSEGLLEFCAVNHQTVFMDNVWNLIIFQSKPIPP